MLAALHDVGYGAENDTHLAAARIGSWRKAAVWSTAWPLT